MVAVLQALRHNHQRPLSRGEEVRFIQRNPSVGATMGHRLLGVRSVMVMLTFVVIAAIPWLMFFRGRFGILASLSLVTLSLPALLIGVLILARTTGARLVVSMVSVVLLAALIGWALALRSRTDGRARGVPLWRQALPAGVGGLVAFGTFLFAPLFPGSSRVSWAMLGDSASQLEYARRIISEGGLTPPPMDNPVPLTPALVAAIAAPGRPSTGADAILSHDLGAYASAWAALIVMTCVLAGAVGYAIVKHSPRLAGFPARATIAATSLLPLGWFWTGYPIKFGFINAQVVFVVLLASILGYLGTQRRPGLGLAIQLVAALLTLLTWSPLVILPAALGLTQAIGALGSATQWSRRTRTVSLVVALVGVGCALWLGIPLLLAASGSLSLPGGLAEFPKPMLPAAAAVLVVATLAGSTRSGRERLDKVGAGLVGLALGAVVGLIVVLELSGSVSGPWTYYPHKYAWIATAMLFTVALPQAACAVARLPWARVRAALFGAGALAVAVSLGLGSWWAPGYLHFLRDSVPYVMLVEDNLPDEGQSPDAVADAVIARVGLPRLTIPWHSSLANDYRVAFWLIHLQIEDATRRGDDPASFELWTLANFHDTPDDLCALAEVVPQGLTVQTADGNLAAQMQALCPAANVIVEGDPLRR